MEADWEVELGPDAPVIEPDWPGFIDLREHPERLREITEAMQFPALCDALSRLNAKIFGRGQGTYTSKCDVWRIEAANDSPAVDPFEMDALSEEATAGVACYIDLLPWPEEVFPSLQTAERWTTAMVAVLRATECRCARIDLVVRRAVLADGEGFGVTAYAQGCGASIDAAETSLSRVLAELAHAMAGSEAPQEPLQ